MKSRKLASASPSTSTAPISSIAQLIDRDSDFDTSTAAWVQFDVQMTAEFAELEHQFRRYWTPTKVREHLGR